MRKIPQSQGNNNTNGNIGPLASIGDLLAMLGAGRTHQASNTDNEDGENTQGRGSDLMSDAMANNGKNTRNAYAGKNIMQCNSIANRNRQDDTITHHDSNYCETSDSHLMPNTGSDDTDTANDASDEQRRAQLIAERRLSAKYKRLISDHDAMVRRLRNEGNNTR